ncbi:MAG: CoA transferase [Actinomycetota bacterium]|jgi:crotonobetainyl-CoA:carnitine CoA-transferase CaiB-like acyl-CoA transferase
MSGILAGVRVIEVATWTFVPAAGAVLADWGAQVIKIEHPETGDPQRGLISSGIVPTAGGVNYLVEQPNRGKRSLGLDIAHPDGLDVLYRLLETADVFLTNLLPHSCARLGIDVASVRARNPKVIYARGHGYGVRGEGAERGGYDAAAYWAQAGIAAAYTSEGGYPPLQRAAFGDIMGGQTIAGGIAGALFRRERTGEPSVVDVSLLGLGLWNLSPDIVAAGILGAPIPGFDRTDMPNPLTNTYRTADGRFVFLVFLQADRHWPELCEAMERPDLLTDDRFADARGRFANRKECIALLDEIFATRTLAEWQVRLSRVQGVWGPVQTALEVHDDPQVLANGYLPELKLDDGTPFRLVANPVQFDETPPELTPAPGHGQHTDEILLELGLDWDHILALKETGALL